MKIGSIDVVATVKATVKDFLAADLQGVAAEIAYQLLFSLVPLLIFFTALSAEIGRRVGTGNVVEQMTDALRNNANLPESTIEVVLVPIEQLLTQQTGGLLSIGGVLALWGGKNAIMALIKGLNVAYNLKETRPWYLTWAIAIGLTIVLALAAIVASVLSVLSSDLGARAAAGLGLSAVWTTAWGWLRFPLMAVILCVMVSFFYWAGPNRRSRYEFINIGSILTVVLWGVATFLLGFYFQFLAGYVIAYGVLGGLLGFLFWLYVMSLILLLGGQLNAILQTQRLPAAANAAPATRVDRLGIRPSTGAAGATTSAPASIQAELRGLPPQLPSAEAAARRDAMGGANQPQDRIRTLRLLGAAAVAAISGVVLGWRNRG